MAYFKVLIFAVVVTLATCEPPVQGYNAPYNYHAANAASSHPSDSYLPPFNHASSGYNSPSSGYNSPSSGYNSPSSGYNSPSSGYNSPSSGYNSPSSGYNSPSSGYNSPSSGYDSYDSHHGGHNSHHENEVPKSYEFGYSVKDAQSGNDYGRKESSDGNTVRGEYRVQLPDGRTQIVTYHADWQTGFHADVRYEGEATYPESQHHQQQGGYNYNKPAISYRPSTAYGPPAYHN